VAKKQNVDKQQRYRQRQAVRNGFSELLRMCFEEIKRDVLIAKIQEVQRLVDLLLNPKKKSLVTNRPATAA
jgi:hypothetical protein